MNVPQRTPAVGKEWNFMILLLNLLDILWITLSGQYIVYDPLSIFDSISKTSKKLLKNIFFGFFIWLRSVFKAKDQELQFKNKRVSRMPF